MNRYWTLTFLFALSLSLVTAPVRAMDAVGEIVGIQGEAKATASDGTVRMLTSGGNVFAKERISTGESARVRIVFKDKSKMSLGPSTEMEVESFSQATPTRGASFGTRFFKGAFRFVTGLIGRRDPASVRVRLPVATIGIRGTHFGAELDETSAKVMLLEPEEGNQPSAIEVANNYGQVVVDEPGYGTEIPDEFSPPSPVRKMNVRSIKNVLRVMRKATRTRGVGTAR